MRVTIMCFPVPVVMRYVPLTCTSARAESASVRTMTEAAKAPNRFRAMVRICRAGYSSCARIPARPHAERPSSDSFAALVGVDSFDDRVPVAVDRDRERERATADRAVLDERLAAAAGRVDAHGIRLAAARAGGGRVGFQGRPA